ncbi:MAG: FKBP-type peptidyl-prolyl cis-trans isomerase [Solobacterium sp.]|nr:FKBP-type peptidyl-prolyl cis-trans isomerase [Solobacterium sp.]
MKIAVTYDNGNVFQHFGKTENFQLFNIEDNRIASSEVITSDGLGHGALAGLLARYQIDVLICGGIGGGARDALAAAGIEVCAGAQGNTEEAVRAYLSGELKGSDESCSHHHEEGHDCGHHDEGHACGGCQGEESGCAGCHGRPEVTGKNAGKTVKVHYRGTLNDGTQFDSSYDRGEPLEFVCGAGMMIFGFDQAVANMEIGETVSVHLMPEEAYGLSNPNAVMVIPMKTLPGSENLEVGQRVMVRDQMGRRFPVRVTAKDETYITLDGNHEMAGRELNFTIELLSAE